jgi:hypothetical protein
MKPARSRLLLLLAVSLVVVGVPLAGKWARRQRGPRCENDGLAIEPVYQVRVVDHAGRSHRFCCVGCARAWLLRQPVSPEAVYVTDEPSGKEIASRSARFVHSTVVTNPTTGNRVHVFQDSADAQEHARAFAGQELTGDERPFDSD